MADTSTGTPSRPSAMDGAAKLRVRDALLRHARSELEAANESVRSEHSAAILDQDSAFSADDQSQSDAANDLAALFAQATAKQREDFEHLESLDFAPAEVVAPGAIIEFGGDRYVVGVVADPFECDGVTYEGISVRSPIYAALDGLRQGDNFTFRGTSHRIDVVA